MTARKLLHVALAAALFALAVGAIVAGWRVVVRGLWP